MPYNPNIHKRKSIRLKGYDYSQEGLYFITLCVHERKYLFGKIENGEMILNDAGQMAHQCWLDIPNHFPQTILHEFIIMPNHIHGIIELVMPVGANNHSPQNTEGINANNHSPNNIEDIRANIDSPNIRANVDSPNISPNFNSPNISPNIDSPNYRANINSPNIGANVDSPQLRSPSQTIGSVVRGYKIGVTKWVRQNKNIEMVWQRNYYEHIIRDNRAYQNISNYIINNPLKWQNDKFYH
jgi:putative transposase